MSTPNLEQIARETAEKIVAAHFPKPSVPYAMEPEFSRMFAYEQRDRIANAQRIILTAIQTVAPQPAKTEEVRRAIHGVVLAHHESIKNVRGMKLSLPCTLIDSLLVALTPYLRTDREPCRDSNGLTPYMEAVLSIGHWDLRYHRLLAACRAVAVSRRAFSSAQSAVLTESLDALESIMAEKPPEWPKSRAAIDAAASANDGRARG
jgi:hypothetical protein